MRNVFIVFGIVAVVIIVSHVLYAKFTFLVLYLVLAYHAT